MVLNMAIQKSPIIYYISLKISKLNSRKSLDIYKIKTFTNRRLEGYSHAKKFIHTLKLYKSNLLIKILISLISLSHI